MAIVDNDFWLEYARNSILKSTESRIKAANNLDTFLTWLWGVYTSVFVLASLFEYLSCSTAQLLIVVQPVVVIIIARFFCTNVGIPGSSKADPNVVQEIIDAHIEVVRRLKQRLKMAKIASIISIISLSVALVGYNLLDPNREMKKEVQQLKLKNEIVEKQKNLGQYQTDSTRMIYEYYDNLIKGELKMRELNCIQLNQYDCLDSLRKLQASPLIQ